MKPSVSITLQICLKFGCKWRRAQIKLLKKHQIITSPWGFYTVVRCTIIWWIWMTWLKYPTYSSVKFGNRSYSSQLKSIDLAHSSGRQNGRPVITHPGAVFVSFVDRRCETKKWQAAATRWVLGQFESFTWEVIFPCLRCLIFACVWGSVGARLLLQFGAV